MSARAELGSVIAACVVGAGLVLLAAGRPWATASVAGLPGRPFIEPSGGDLAPIVTGLGLAALAGGLAVLATRGIARTLVGAFLVLAGLGVVGGLLAVLTDLERALHGPAVDAAGYTSAVVENEQATGWPLAASAGAVLVAAAGLAVMVRGRRWPGMSSRYERGGDNRRDGPASLWDALSRGDDPTA